MKKNNLQEYILGLLSRQSAARTDDLVEEIEVEIEAECDADHKTKPRYTIARTIKHLANRGMIELHDTPQSTFARLTPSGRHKLRSIRLNNESNLIPTNWDGRWRIVVLDIPESRKQERDSLRYLLKKANFVLLKNSVWVSPFPLEHFLSNLKDDLDLEEEFIIMVAEYLDPKIQDRLLREFGLK